jgi:hypothetical protein
MARQVQFFKVMVLAASKKALVISPIAGALRRKRPAGQRQMGSKVGAAKFADTSTTYGSDVAECDA